MKGSIACTTLLAMGLASQLHAQATLTGTVQDVSTNQPLGGVEVVIDGTDRTGTTDEFGWFVVGGVPEGRRIVLFRKVGYRPLQTLAVFRRGDTTVVDGALIGLSVQLDSILVRGTEARSRGLGIGREAFEERRNKGFGIFIDSTVLRRNEHRDLADIIRGNPGITISNRQRGGGYIISAGRGATRCAVQMYLDGMPLPPNQSTAIASVGSLEAVEVYRSSAETPLEYGGPRANCGVVLLWTRRGR